MHGGSKIGGAIDLSIMHFNRLCMLLEVFGEVVVDHLFRKPFVLCGRWGIV